MLTFNPDPSVLEVQCILSVLWSGFCFLHSKDSLLIVMAENTNKAIREKIYL